MTIMPIQWSPRVDHVRDPRAGHGGAMQQAQVETQNLEQVARDVGYRWGARLKAQYLASEQTIGSWPGTLEEARRLIDAAVGYRVPDDERELLALLVERGARRAWHSSDRGVAAF